MLSAAKTGFVKWKDSSPVSIDKSCDMMERHITREARVEMFFGIWFCCFSLIYFLLFIVWMKFIIFFFLGLFNTQYLRYGTRTGSNTVERFWREQFFRLRIWREQFFRLSTIVEYRLISIFRKIISQRPVFSSTTFLVAF